MRPSRKNSLFLLLGALLLTACTGTRNLPTGEKLYTGAEIKVESVDKVNKKFVKATAETGIRPSRNKVYLGIRPKLWMYQMAGDHPKGKLKLWLRKNGEAPVLMRHVKPGVTSAFIDAKLFNIGIFKSFTESKIVEKKHTFRVIYTSHVHKPYLVKELSYAISDDSISLLVRSVQDKSLVKSGDNYNLELLKAERSRLDAVLKNNGYYYFNPDYFLFKADTSNTNHDVSFKLTLNDSIPANAVTVYRINNVYLNQNYSLTGQQNIASSDTTGYENRAFTDNEKQMSIRPKVIAQSVYLRKSEEFSRLNHIVTLNRLMSLGNFKLVQVNFSEVGPKPSGLLDVKILMTPMAKHTFRAGMDIVNKSNNFTGPQMNLGIMNRNTFGGAELLNLTMAGSIEGQLSGPSRNLFSYSWGPQLELTFPRFMLPFKTGRTSSFFVPRTRLLLSYNYVKRVSYYDMQTFQFIYGFKWKENARKEHELNPIDLSFSTVGNKSDAFLLLIGANPFLNKSFEEKFIAGATYKYTYSEQAITGKKVQYYFHLATELAGNVFSLAKIVAGKTISAKNPATIAGSVYAQYAKMSLDGRVYYNLPDKNRLVGRLFAGIGQPYGNSDVMPYSKQFFSGGPNSLRAFPYNSVGPGTYFQDTGNNAFAQLGGDIKLEMNAEYRFNIFRFLKGALFTDAGNVWLLKSNPSGMGSAFRLSGFLKELAVGAGAGLRIDVSFFVLRFDLAMPLRKPWFEADNRWVIDQIDVGNADWRGKNLIFNAAIGYPF